MIADYDFQEQLSFVDSGYSTKNPSPIASDAILQCKAKTISDDLHGPMIRKAWSTICTNETQAGQGIFTRTLKPLKWLEDSPTQSSHAGRLSNA
jgi:hypothetical protein